MTSYIAISEIPLGLDKYQTFEDGTIIEKLFNNILIIRTNNSDIINWFNEIEKITIEQDTFVLPFYIPNDTQFNKQWAHNSSQHYGNKTSNFWDRFEGQFQYSEKAICIIDTGIAPHSDLDNSRIIINYDNNDVYALSIKGDGTIIKHTTINDDTQFIHPHGTHVAGIAGAIINNEKGIAGSYKNKLFSINVFEEIFYLGKKYVGAYISSVLKALEICSNYSNEIRSINLSLGGGYSEVAHRAYRIAFEALHNSEILICIAAGNSGYDVGIWKPLPAYIKTNNSFTISSSNKNGELSWFSNYGYYYCDVMVAGGTVVEAMADGKFHEEDIISCLPNNANDDVYNSFLEGNDRYGYMAGTSMASPYAVGIINILVELILSEYPQLTFNQLCDYVRLALIGASYKHTEEAFDKLISGGLFDASLLKGALTRPVIQKQQIYYDYDNNKLVIPIKNITNTARNIWVSVASNQFVSPFETNSSNLIAISNATVNPNEIYTFNINIESDQWNALIKVGILSAYYDNNEVIGVYDKEKYYNTLECPQPLCSAIQIRCAEEVYLPFDSNKYPLTLSGMLSNIAERAQKRLLFFYNSQKINGRYIYYYPIATNGVCLNTINYPNATIPFQVREDATENDLIYAYFSIYTQLREIFENGFYFNGQNWYIFDYEAWKQGNKNIYKRKLLPDSYKLDETYLRKDKIGQVIKAINDMILWSRVVFTVNINIKHYTNAKYLYYADCDEEGKISFPLGYSITGNFSFETADPNSSPQILYDNGVPYVNWDGYFFDNPGYGTCYNNWIFGNSSVMNCNDNKDITFILSSGIEVIHLFGIKPNNVQHRLCRRTDTNNPNKIIQNTINYYYGYLPESIYYVKEENENNPQPIPYNQITQWQDNFNVYGMYIDKPRNIMGVPCNYDYFYTEENANGFYGGTYNFFRNVEIGSLRTIVGNYSYLKINPICEGYNIEIETPIKLVVNISGLLKTHYDTGGDRLPQNINENDKNKTYKPNTQKCISRYIVNIKKYTEINGNYQYINIFTKYYDISVAGNPFNYIADYITVDLKASGAEHLYIEVIPDADICKSNPTHSLILPAKYEGYIVIPPFKSYTFTYAPHLGQWIDFYKTDNIPIYKQGMTNYYACYTRDIGTQITIKNDTSISKPSFDYPDLRGIVIDEYFNELKNFLGIQEIFWDSNNTRHATECSGWRKYSDNDPSGQVIIDQLPPYKFPVAIINENIATGMMFTIGKINENKEVPIRKKALTVNKIYYPSYCINYSAHAYISPSNNVIYKLKEPFENRIGIARSLESNIPNLIDKQIEYIEGQWKIKDYELGYEYKILINNDYYHPSADGNTIKYQFPNDGHFIVTFSEEHKIIIYLFVPDNNEKENYNNIYIPNLRGLNNIEIEKYNNLFEIINLGICNSSFSKTIVADQFPRGGVWYIKKEINKPKIFILNGANSGNIISKILNYAF